jgi:hypothetical protein
VSRESGNLYGYIEKEDYALSNPVNASKTLVLLSYPEDGGCSLFQNVGKHLTQLHVVISQQTEIFSRSSLCLPNALDLYLGDPRFESRPGYRLCCLRFLVVYLSPSGEIPRLYLHQVTIVSSQTI